VKEAITLINDSHRPRPCESRHFLVGSHPSSETFLSTETKRSEQHITK